MAAFVEPSHVLDHAQCAVCHGVLQKPKMLENCDHVFCEDCVFLCVRSQCGRPKTCPECRAVYHANRLRNVSIQFKNLVAELRMRCAHEGCNAIIRARESERHHRTCRFGLVPCRWTGCGQRVQRGDAIPHYMAHMDSVSESYCLECQAYGSCPLTRALGGAGSGQ